MTNEPSQHPDDLLRLAVRAARNWRALPLQARTDSLATYALSEILVLRSGAEDEPLWQFPRSVGARLVLDFGCREEARRRGHDFDAPIVRAVAQATELQGFRAGLEASLASISDWDGFMARVREHATSV